MKIGVSYISIYQAVTRPSSKSLMVTELVIE